MNSGTYADAKYLDGGWAGGGIFYTCLYLMKAGGRARESSATRISFYVRPPPFVVSARYICIGTRGRERETGKKMGFNK